MEGSLCPFLCVASVRLQSGVGGNELAKEGGREGGSGGGGGVGGEEGAVGEAEDTHEVHGGGEGGHLCCCLCISLCGGGVGWEGREGETLTSKHKGTVKAIKIQGLERGEKEWPFMLLVVRCVCVYYY